jgi:hypothetical protein
METPPAQRAISEKTPVKLELNRFVAIVVGACLLSVAAALWADNVVRFMRAVDVRLQRIEKALGIEQPPATAGTSFGSKSKGP